MSTDEHSMQQKNNRKKIILIAAVAAVVVIAAVIIAVVMIRNSPTRRLQRQLDLGNRYLSELQYDDAIAAYEAALAIEPRSAEAYRGLIASHGGNQDVGGVIDAYEASLGQLSGTESDEIGKYAAELSEDILRKLMEEDAYEQAQQAAERLKNVSFPEQYQNRITLFLQENEDEIRMALAAPVDVKDLPEQFYAFMDRWLYPDDHSTSKEWNCKGTITEDNNCLRGIASSYVTRVNWDIYPVVQWQYADDNEIRSVLPGLEQKEGLYKVYDRDSTDWIAQHIFHMSKEQLERAVQLLESRDDFFVADFFGNTSYCTVGIEPGSPDTFLLPLSARFYGERYYVVYDLCDGLYAYDEGGNRIDWIVLGRYLTIGSLETIDGEPYWTMYYNGVNVPDLMQPDWRLAYRVFVNEKEYFSDEYGLELGYDMMLPEMNYFLYDMNRDNIPELIAYNFSYMAAATGYVFYYKDGHVNYAGNIGFRSPDFWTSTEERFPGLFHESGNMGYFMGHYYELRDGSIAEELVAEENEILKEDGTSEGMRETVITQNQPLYEAYAEGKKSGRWIQLHTEEEVLAMDWDTFLAAYGY